MSIQSAELERRRYEHGHRHGRVADGVAIALCASIFGFLGPAQASAGHILSVTAKGGFGNLIPVDATFNGVTGTFWSGIQSASLDGGPWFDAYCVDLYHDNFLPASYPVVALHIGDLTDPPLTPGPYATGGNGAGVGYLYNTNASGASNDIVKAAALQVAIWTEEYGGSFQDKDSPLMNGTLQQRVAYQTNSYLADYNANYNAATLYDATWFPADPHNGALYQDLVGPYVPNPEPSTLVMGAIGMVTCLGVWARRRR